MDIAIVGGGAAGVLAAVHLRRTLPPHAARITIIESRNALGHGLAYSTADPGHLLNVRVSNMSAFPDEPDHLINWLKQYGEAFGVCGPTPYCFIPRSAYGAYIASLAHKLIGSGSARHLQDRCLGVSETGDGVVLSLQSGGSLVADHVVLATGNNVKRSLEGIPADQPWGEDALAGLAPDAPVLILGTGLTMVDMVLSLMRRGHSGKITALSRRGLLPHAHRQVGLRPIATNAIPFGADLTALIAWLRELSDQEMRKGGDWRSVIDGLRPHTRRLWQSMSAEQRRRFLRHARPYWDVHRHRMAPQIEQQLGELRNENRLEIIVGRIKSAAQSSGELRLRSRSAAKRPGKHAHSRALLTVRALLILRSTRVP